MHDNSVLHVYNAHYCQVWNCVILKTNPDPNFLKKPTTPFISPTTSSHGTNLAFFLTEDGFNRLLLTTLFLGRSLKRLSLVCWNSMLDPDLLLTTTSSRPPIISTVLPKESRNYSPAQNPALSSASAHEPCEPVCKPASVSVCCWQEVMWGDFTEARGCSAACFRTEWSCGWNAEWSEMTYHSHLSPPMSLFGDTPCTASCRLLQFKQECWDVFHENKNPFTPLARVRANWP